MIDPSLMASDGVPPLVVSLHPAMDVEWRVRTIRPSEKNEIISERRWPGGKGINVARWLNWNGCQSRLFLPLGGDSGNELAAGLTREKISFLSHPMTMPNRTNVVVTQDVGPQFRFNPHWRRLPRSEFAGLYASVASAMAAHSTVILSGALPPGVPPGTYSRLIRCGRQAGIRMVLDCDGTAFRDGAKGKPWLVKPNRAELAEWTGKNLDTRESILSAARKLASVTGGLVLVSLDSEGALLTDSAGRGVQGIAPAMEIRNAVGAGDSLLATFVARKLRGDSNLGALHESLAVASAFVVTQAGGKPARRTVSMLRAKIRMQEFPVS